MYTHTMGAEPINSHVYLTWVHLVVKTFPTVHKSLIDTVYKQVF